MLSDIQKRNATPQAYAKCYYRRTQKTQGSWQWSTIPIQHITGITALKSKPNITKNFLLGAEAKQHVFEYIEVYYNHKRLHSKLGCLSLETFEVKMVS